MTFYRPQGMEIACERPGKWRIEGYHVERTRADGKVWWQVFQRFTGQPERFVGKAHTLEDACTVVDDDQHRRRHGGDSTP